MGRSTGTGSSSGPSASAAKSSSKPSRTSGNSTPRAGRAKARAGAVTGDREQPDLFVEDHADEAIPVRLKRIRLERGRRFGDVWLGWTLWRALRLDEALTRLLPEGRETVPGATMAAVLLLPRLKQLDDRLPDERLYHVLPDWTIDTASAFRGSICVGARPSTVGVHRRRVVRVELRQSA